MCKLTLGIIVGVAASAAALAQPAPHRAEFEVASIRPSAASGADQVAAGVHIDGAQVNCVAMSLKAYIGIAFDVKDYQVSGPDWLAGQRYNIAAKFADVSERAKFSEMVESLLEDRFGMKTHREKRDLPVYMVVVGKGGSKLKEVAADSASPGAADPGKPFEVTGSGSAAGININLGNGSVVSFANNHLEGRKLTMAQFTQYLAMFMDRPVMDGTDLKGKYDFSVELTPEDYRAMMIRAAVKQGVNLPPQALALLDQASSDSLVNTIESALGLKLDSRKAPTDMVVVDHIEKTPSDN